MQTRRCLSLHHRVDFINGCSEDFFLLYVCLRVWLQHVSVFPAAGVLLAGAPQRDASWKLRLRVVVFLCTVSFELTNMLIIIIIINIIIFYTDVCIVVDMMWVLWAGCQRVLCVSVVSYVPTIAVMSSCTQPTKCWLKTDISVNFKQYEGFVQLNSCNIS